MSFHNIEIPYKSGFRTTIRQHVPPPPFEGGYRTIPTRTHPRQNEYTMPAEWYLMFPPIETPPPENPRSSAMEIVSVLRSKRKSIGHVVKCRIGNDDTPYVAKIYDTFYHQVDRFYYVPSRPRDCCKESDRQYAAEAHAYEKLQMEGVDGCFAPKYFGSWTFDMPVPARLIPDVAAAAGGQVVRSVRMILIQWVPGSSLFDMEATGEIWETPREQRLDLLGQILELDCKLKFHGVRHCDLAPRNVMVTKRLNNGGMRALVVDFDRSFVRSSPYSALERGPARDLPRNPIDAFWDGADSCFYTLIPGNYFHNCALFNGWLLRRYGNAVGFAKPEEHGDNFGFADPETPPRPRSPTLSELERSSSS